MRLHQCLVVALALGGIEAWAQDAPKPEPSAPQQATPQPPATKPAETEPEEKEEAAAGEDFVEEEPATPAEKLKKDELEKRACPKVDVKFTTKTDKTQHPTPEPAEGMALVYVLRPTMNGHKIQTKLAVDGTWVGANRGHNYFFLQLAPGEHYFCSRAENTSVMPLKVEAGKTYYVEQKIKMGFLKARNKLAALSDEEGKKKLAKSHPSSWEEKK